MSPAKAARLARRQRVQELRARGLSVTEIAAQADVTPGTIYNDLKEIGALPIQKLRLRPPGNVPALKPKRNGKADVRKREAGERKAGEVRDRRRFMSVPVPMGEPARLASDEACEAGRTMFPARVFHASEAEPVLKDGSNNAKIGGDVLVGRLRGARIVTLTLEERATCPRTCSEWRGCYGNSMQHARRWRPGPDLVDRLRAELADLCARHEILLVRLHVLGDFYSVEYVRFWLAMLNIHPGLHVFGFTAHRRGSTIGEFVSRVRSTFPDRFMVRHSGQTGPWGAFTLPFPTHVPRIGDAVVCPEQRHAIDNPGRGTHCGNCAVCWQTDRPIAFILH